jgi:subtilase family serine protease
MVKCTQITVDEQTQDRSEIEITAIDAPNATFGETIEVTVTVSNKILEGDGESLTGDVLISGFGHEATDTVQVSPGASKDININFVPGESGQGEICAELI